MAQPLSQDDQQVEWVSNGIIRQHFNAGQFYERVAAGQLIAILKRNSHPAKPPAGEPVCTRSQILFYYNLNGDFVAVVHQYYRPDGTLGASGRPDPKRLFIEGKLFAVRTPKKSE